jgi:hypothetical protein
MRRTASDYANWNPTVSCAFAPRRSCVVLKSLGPEIQWVQSFVTEDKITCVYIAPNVDLVRTHARLGGFPADRVLEVGTIIDPTTAESRELVG